MRIFSCLTSKDLESAYIHPNFMPHETALFKQDAGVEYVKFTDLETQQKLCEIMETSCIGWLTTRIQSRDLARCRRPRLWPVFYNLSVDDVDVPRSSWLWISQKAITQEGENVYSLRESFQLLSFPTISRKFSLKVILNNKLWIMNWWSTIILISY